MNLSMNTLVTLNHVKNQDQLEIMGIPHLIVLSLGTDLIPTLTILDKLLLKDLLLWL